MASSTEAARTVPDPAPDPLRARVRAWLLSGERAKRIQGPHREPAADETAHTHAWWQVMCLTGVDYFSTLGYQPGIAALAAGVVSPFATLVLVLLTLFGALPIYRRVAGLSWRGEGSIAMLEHLLSFWAGKIFVLALLGFAATDFLITITLSAADASAHLLENPYVPSALHGHAVLVTLVLVALLGIVFLRGFAEAINIAVGLVGTYLLLNLVVVAVSTYQIVHQPQLVVDWRDMLVAAHPDPLGIAAVALVVFPRLALGLSGFETGVAVLPQIRGYPTDDPDSPTGPTGRIRGGRKLLTTAAIIMSFYLVTTSFVTTVLIPAADFRPGGEANGRALAFLAHEYLGGAFGTVYDASTITILWFAGASALAGLLNIVPRYLPRYGMAPEWARATRPLVLVFMALAFFVTWYFKADVNAQGGAYATGVLVLIFSASFAVTLAARKRRSRKGVAAFAAITLVFGYTLVTNVFERPEGVKIAGLFIAGIVIISFVARVTRATELRVTGIHLDDTARRFLAAADTEGLVRIIANEPGPRDAREYLDKERDVRRRNHIPDDDPILFLEVTVRDASDFESELDVHGKVIFGFRVLRVDSSTVANAIAALLLEIRDQFGVTPHVYFEWTEGNPLKHVATFFFFGHGEVAPITREVLREAEPDPLRRPVVHVA